MYRRRLPVYQRSGSGIKRMIILGILLGLAFLVYDRLSQPSAEPTPQPTAQVAVLPTLTPTLLLPTATPRLKANLYVPTVGVNASIVDVYLDGVSWDVSELGTNVGHLEGTSWFGMKGNIALAGHVEMPDGRAGVFSQLERIQTGDLIILTYGVQEQRYTVTEVRRVQPDDLTVLYPTSEDRITLITCDEYNFIQNIYAERVVVMAERVA